MISLFDLRSCTPNDNTRFNIHVIQYQRLYPWDIIYILPLHIATLSVYLSLDFYKFPMPMTLYLIYDFSILANKILPKTKTSPPPKRKQNKKQDNNLTVSFKCILYWKNEPIVSWYYSCSIIFFYLQKLAQFLKMTSFHARI